MPHLVIVRACLPGRAAASSARHTKACDSCNVLQLVAKAFPQQAAVNKVAEVATKFWRTHPHKHIAIHCAYGEAAASCQPAATCACICGPDAHCTADLAHSPAWCVGATRPPWWSIAALPCRALTSIYLLVGTTPILVNSMPC